MTVSLHTYEFLSSCLHFCRIAIQYALNLLAILLFEKKNYFFSFMRISIIGQVSIENELLTMLIGGVSMSCKAMEPSEFCSIVVMQCLTSTTGQDT